MQDRPFYGEGVAGIAAYDLTTEILPRGPSPRRGAPLAGIGAPVIRSTSLWIALALVGCRPSPDPKLDSPAGAPPFSSAQVRHEGSIACIPGPAVNAAGLPVTCEPSGVTQVDGEIWIANDKPLPGHSPMMRLPLAGDRLGTPSYAETPSLAQIQKYEDLATVPDGAGLLAITGFDRVSAATAAMDAYNVLLSWTPGEEPVLVRASTRSGVASSVGLREEIARALADERFPDGPPTSSSRAWLCCPTDACCWGFGSWARAGSSRSSS